MKLIIRSESIQERLSVLEFHIHRAKEFIENPQNIRVRTMTEQTLLHLIEEQAELLIELKKVKLEDAAKRREWK